MIAVPPPPDPVAVDVKAKGLLAEALGEEPRGARLTEFAPVVVALRQRGFTYREIGEWLTARGVPVDHNGVWRLHRWAKAQEDGR